MRRMKMSRIVAKMNEDFLILILIVEREKFTVLINWYVLDALECKDDKITSQYLLIRETLELLLFSKKIFFLQFFAIYCLGLIQ